MVKIISFFSFLKSKDLKIAFQFSKKNDDENNIYVPSPHG